MVRQYKRDFPVHISDPADGLRTAASRRRCNRHTRNGCAPIQDGGVIGPLDEITVTVTGACRRAVDVVLVSVRPDVSVIDEHVVRGVLAWVAVPRCVESHEVHRIRGFDERVSLESPIVPAAVWLSDVYNRAVAGDVVVEETTYAGVWRGQVSVNRADREARRGRSRRDRVVGGGDVRSSRPAHQFDGSLRYAIRIDISEKMYRTNTGARMYGDVVVVNLNVVRAKSHLYADRVTRSVSPTGSVNSERFVSGNNIVVNRAESAAGTR